MKRVVATIAAITIILCSANPLSAEYIPPFSPTPTINGPVFNYMNANLWAYIRLGLNYLESPQPLSPPESVPPTYVHPDGRGFGAYGLSPEAYEDIQSLYPFFQDYQWEDILHSPKLYDLANRAFADWLLKNLQDYLPASATKQETFDVLHKAWNLGLSGFRQGRNVVASRARRAGEFLARTNTSL